MNQTPTFQARLMTRLRSINILRTSIGAKIIVPYLFLTLMVAAAGAFIVTTLVTGSLQERFHNQLLDAGRVVAESMVQQERERLAVLRAVVSTQGVAEGVHSADREGLAALVPQIIANSQMDGVVILAADGRHLYSWQRQASQAGHDDPGLDWAALPPVRHVLDAVVDEFGDKYVLLQETPSGRMLYTVAPLYLEDDRVGAVLVGSLLRRMVVDLTETAVARVTLYDSQGQVVETTLGLGATGADTGERLARTAEETGQILALLRQPANRHQVVIVDAGAIVPLSQVELLGQQYWLAYGDWRVRGQSFGLFSVALPGNFIVTAAATSRRLLSLVFFLATILVFLIGFVVARRIVRPLNHLVETSLAVAAGDLQKRSGLTGDDEIGHLAQSFDLMTQHLAERNRELMEQAGKLEAVLNSIADGVIVLDTNGKIVTLNPAATKLLADAATMPGSVPRPFAGTNGAGNGSLPAVPDLLRGATAATLQRYRAGSRVLSTLASPVKTSDNQVAGNVIVVRDITREVEAEELKEGFITSISHELRTPLTSILGYSKLMMMSAASNLDENQQRQLQRISDSAEKLNHYIDEIINISQIQAGSLVIKKERLDLRHLLLDVSDRWREPMQAKDLTLDLILARSAYWVNGDYVYLSRAIDNLFNNAHNYTLAGGRVTVCLFQEGREVRLQVHDTGVGVAAVDLPYLFQRFFRASNEMTFTAGGVGLGLYIARTIVELHEGRIWANSKLGVGSVFALALPLAERSE
jgi:signal transduction histidine kinase